MAEIKLLDGVGDGFIAIDSTGLVVYCNAAAADLLGVDLQSLSGRDLFEAAPVFSDVLLQDNIRAALAQAECGRGAAFRLANERSVQLRSTPLADGGVVLQFTEVTHQVARDRNIALDLARLAHDLRNPLAPLRTSLELLSRPAVAEPIKERARSIMGRQLDQMVGLIDRLNDIAGSLCGGELLRADDFIEPPAATGTATTTTSTIGGQSGEASGLGKGERVLVADDSALVQQAVVALLRAEGYEVRTVSDGLEAIAAAEEWRPRYVLLDMNMPRLGGVDAAKRLRQSHPVGEVVLLMMSGVTLDDSWRSHAKLAGFDACLDKTADPAEWLSAMRRAGVEAGMAARITSGASDSSVKS